MLADCGLDAKGMVQSIATVAALKLA